MSPGKIINNRVIEMISNSKNKNGNNVINCTNAKNWLQTAVSVVIHNHLLQVLRTKRREIGSKKRRENKSGKN